MQNHAYQFEIYTIDVYQVLASTNITIEAQRHQIASDLTVLTSNLSKFTEEDVEDTIIIIESILKTDSIDQTVGLLQFYCNVPNSA